MGKFHFTITILMVLFVFIPLNSNSIEKESIETLSYMPGEFLIKLKKDVLINNIIDHIQNKNFEIKKHYSHLSKLSQHNLFLIKTDDNKTLKSQSFILSELKKIKGIQTVTLNHKRTASEMPNDPSFYQQWGLNNTGQIYFEYGTKKGTPGVDVNASKLWELSKGNSDVVVAVIDTGVDYNHEDLRDNIWINNNEIPNNNIDDDNNGYVDDYFGYDFASTSTGDNDSDPMDLLSKNHGTHVAGIIASLQNNGVGISGVAPGVKVMALKAFRPNGYIYTSDTIEALEYIVKMKSQFGVNIVAVNCSFGGTSSNTLERETFELAGDAGIIIVAAAGNGDDDGNPINNDSSPHYPSSYKISNLISVAATDADGNLGSFSNFGYSSVDMGAPGVDIKSTVITGSGSGTGTLVVNNNIFYVLKLTYAKNSDSLSGGIYYCGKGLSGSDFPAAVSGNIALIERGDALFSEKATNAKNAGAVGVIIFNNVDGPFAGTLGSVGDWPVVVAISREDGLNLKNFEGQIANISVPLTNYDFKNGTSMAAPHVAGAVALYASLYPNDPVQKRYLRTLFCGKQKDDLGLKLKIGSILDFQSFFIQPVLNISGTRVSNRSLLQTQYIDVISWQKNSQNYDHNISKYNIYKIEDNDISFLNSVSANTNIYNNEDLSASKSYFYVVVPVSSSGVLGEPSSVFVDKK